MLDLVPGGYLFTHLIFWTVIALVAVGTNAVAILLVGGFTFVVTGVVPTYQVAEGQHRVTTSLAAVIALAAMVVGAPLLHGLRLELDPLHVAAQVLRVVSHHGHERLRVRLDVAAQHQAIRLDAVRDAIRHAVILPPTERARCEVFSVRIARFWALRTSWEAGGRAQRRA
ncbi:hypothetical protein [uncultured Demequina sp.]|uniref:hypothetical protein n=1 Tax=uncultured Demequina sp. TaxID=693499 RepID=UPI0025E76B5E|nr:hypothetical protein [uncultured Demequina sp.]